MKSAITHCVAGANGSSEWPSVPKPPVGIVENACATASKPVMRSSMSVTSKASRITMSAAVSAR
jgi:hypothetical protein